MQADFDNMEVGDYAMIANSVEIEDNAKLYYKTETEWVFITDFSGATGIQGEQGPQGIQGIQGERGIGISKLEVIDGSLWVTLTDSTKQNAGLIITDEVKQWIVNQVTENAKSKFNTYYDGKVTDFDNHATVKTNEFNTNATNKVNEYNQNAESLINRVAECEEENERLRNDIKSIAVVGEENGESIHIEDSSDARCELEIGGNQQQEIREGYNLLDLSNFSTQTKNGVTATKNEDGSIKLVGTNSGDTFNFNLSTTNGEIGDYIASGVTGGSRETYFLAIVQPGVKTFAEVTNGSSNFSLTEEVTIATNIYIIKGATINTTIYPMMIKGTEQKPYEQYGASPSIDYPSKVKSVGDNINMLFTNPDDWEQGTIVDGANASSMTRIRNKNFIDIIDNEDYYFSISNTQYCFLNIALYKEDKTYIGQYYVLNNAINGANHLKINLPTDAKKIRVIIRNLDNVSDISPSDIEMIKPKLEKSSVATPYSSYNCGSAKIDIFNKNIFKEKTNKKDIKKAYNDIIGGILNIKKGEICIISFDTNNNQGGLYLNENIFSFQGNYSVTCDGKRHYLIGKAKDNINKNVTILKTNKETTNNYDISNVLVTKYDASNVDTKYIEHQEQSYLVDVQQEMLEGDTFVKQDGKWYEKHNWITLLNENITNNIDGIKDESKKAITTSINLTETPAERSAISNILTYANNWNDTEHMIFSASLNTIYCLYNKDRFSELNYETIKKEIGEFGGIIKYKSNKSTYLECTEAQSKVLDEIYSKAHTYKNITNISAESSEVNPIINVKYLKDTEKYIENKITSALTEINANN